MVEKIVLEVKDLCKNFGGNRVLNNVTFEVAEGSRVAIIGPNGAGKTTLFNIISGLLRPTMGKVFFMGKDITSLPPHRRRKIGISRSFQVSQLFSELIVEEHVLLAQRAARLERSQGIMCACDRDDVLSRFGLSWTKDRVVSLLDYGTKKKLDVALAFVGDPLLVILDEPTAGLGRADARVITDAITSVGRETTVLMCSHDLDFVFQVAEWVIVLSFGSVIAQGKPEEIAKNEEVRRSYLGR